jgi:hypothetical protein
MCAVPGAIQYFQVYFWFVVVLHFIVVRAVVVPRWGGIREEWKEFTYFQ